MKNKEINEELCLELHREITELLESESRNIASWEEDKVKKLWDLINEYRNELVTIIEDA